MYYLNCPFQSKLNQKRKTFVSKPSKKRNVLKEVKGNNASLSSRTRKHIVFDDDGNPKQCFVHEVSQNVGKIKRQAIV